MCNGITGQTIDIVEDRRLDNLIRYFFYYNYKARSSVKYIIIDKFHLTQLVSRAFNKTRNYKLLKSVLINPNNNISSYMKTAVKTLSEFLPYIRTNISSNEMLSLIGDIGTLMSGTLEQNRFPTDEQGQGKMIDGVYYMTFDIEEVKNSLHQYIFQ